MHGLGPVCQAILRVMSVVKSLTIDDAVKSPPGLSPCHSCLASIASHQQRTTAGAAPGAAPRGGGFAPVDRHGFPGAEGRHLHVRLVRLAINAPVVAERKHEIGLGQLMILAEIAQQVHRAHMPVRVRSHVPIDPPKVEGRIGAVVAQVLARRGDGGG